MTVSHIALFSQLATQAYKDGIVKLVAGGVIGDKSAVLILRRKADDFMPGIYELPSGVVEKDETIDQGLVREVLEETALTVNNIQQYLGHFDYLSGSGKRTRQFNFVVQVNLPLDVALTEHDEYAWCKQEDIKKYNLTEATVGILNEYFKLLSQ